MSEPVQLRASFTTGWQDLGPPAKETEIESAVRTAALSSLHDELRLITSAENLIVLAGLGTSLSVTNSIDKKKVAPRMSDLWAEVQGLKTFATAKPHLDASIISSGNLEHVLSDAQTRSALGAGE